MYSRCCSVEDVCVVQKGQLILASLGDKHVRLYFETIFESDCFTMVAQYMYLQCSLWFIGDLGQKIHHTCSVHAQYIAHVHVCS